MNVQGPPIGAIALGWYAATSGPERTTATSPLPEPAAGADPSDGLAMLLTLVSKKTQGQLEQGKTDVSRAAHERQRKFDEAQQAYQKMIEARNNPFGFFEGLFKAITTVASAIASVATAGAASPLLTASAVGFSTAVRETQCLGDLSDVVGAGGSLAGSLMSGNMTMILADGAGLTGAVGVQTKAFDEDVAAALQIGAQVTKAIGTFQQATTGPADGALANHARTTRVAGEIGRGIATVGRVVKDGEAAQAEIDVKAAVNQMRRMERLVEVMIDGLEETQESHNRAVRAVEGAIRINSQTMLAAAGGMKV